MTLAELRYLVAVADVRHFGRAAERCRITQPTLSSQLRKLEETLGAPLVERTTRFVTLTPIGERVVAHARRILEQADGYRVMPLFEEPFCLACPTGHKLSNRPFVTERELAHERLLLLDEGHCLRDQALAVCGNRSTDNEGVNDDFRATSLETISEMVAAGLGCTLLPAMAVPHLTARHGRLEVRPFHAARAHRRIGLLWRSSFPRGDDLEVFGRFVQQQLPDSVEPIVTADHDPPTKASRAERRAATPSRSRF